MNEYKMTITGTHKGRNCKNCGTHSGLPFKYVKWNCEKCGVENDYLFDDRD